MVRQPLHSIQDRMKKAPKLAHTTQIYCHFLFIKEEKNESFSEENVSIPSHDVA